MTNTIYRVIAQRPSKGIERALPYELPSEEVSKQVVDALNRILQPEYSHYFVSVGAPTSIQERGSHARKR